MIFNILERRNIGELDHTIVPAYKLVRTTNYEPQPKELNHLKLMPLSYYLE